MDGLHENRADFDAEVQNAVSEDLLKNGLSLESVSLTALDQTPFEALNENNAFNAVGMHKLAEVIATSKNAPDRCGGRGRRRRAAWKERQKLLIDQDEQQARIEQMQQVETMRVAQEAEIAARTETRCVRRTRPHRRRNHPLCRDRARAQDPGGESPRSANLRWPSRNVRSSSRRNPRKKAAPAPRRIWPAPKRPKHQAVAAARRVAEAGVKQIV